MYLKFKAPSAESVRPPKVFINYVRSLFQPRVTLETPRSNPNFDEILCYVTNWYVEFDAQNGFPIRELGTDASGDVIMIMPWQRNYGFWSDKKIKLKQFYQQLDAIETDQHEFDGLWHTFESRHSDKFNNGTI